MTESLESISKEEFMKMYEAARKSLSEATGCPRHFYHPDYGWVLRDGEITECGKEFIADYHRGELQKAMNIVLKKGVIKNRGDVVYAHELETNKFSLAWAYVKNFFSRRSD